MDNLVNEMTDESLEHIGDLVVAKLKRKQSNERRIAVNQIFNAIYAPITPVDNRLEHLIGFVRETYNDLGDNDAAKKSFSLQIRKICMQMGSNAHDNDANVENLPNVANQIGDGGVKLTVAIAAPTKWYDRNKKIGKKVRILIGTNIGTVARVDGIDNNMLSVQLADGKIVKYLYKHIEFFE